MIVYFPSYYQYSVGEGFNTIEGYDLFDSSKGLNLTMDKKISNQSIYVVHAKKTLFPDISDDRNFYPYINLKMSGYQNIDSNDKLFLVVTPSILYFSISNSVFFI